MIVHGVLIARAHPASWRGVLITGPSGSGKSDLALRLIDEGFVLVADDRVLLWASGGRLFGRAPEAIAGLLEARGVGIGAYTPLPFAPIALEAAMHLPVEIERLPEPEVRKHLGVTVPMVRIAPREPSATAKLRRALNSLG